MSLNQADVGIGSAACCCGVVTCPSAPSLSVGSGCLPRAAGAVCLGGIGQKTHPSALAGAPAWSAVSKADFDNLYFHRNNKNTARKKEKQEITCTSNILRRQTVLT